jgi:Uma2 family endonuclease
MPDWLSVHTRLRRMTVDDYHRLIEIGFFAPGERLELIEGLVVLKDHYFPSHSGCVAELHEWFGERLKRRVSIRSQLPITITVSQSEPEPDLVLARRTSYRESHPTPEDIFLIVEVSESSLWQDQHVKLPMYAEAGIPEYWIVNLQDGQLEVYCQPVQNTGKSADYLVKKRYISGYTIAPLAFPECLLAVGDILG